MNTHIGILGNTNILRSFIIIFEDVFSDENFEWDHILDELVLLRSEPTMFSPLTHILK